VAGGEIKVQLPLRKLLRGGMSGGYSD